MSSAGQILPGMRVLGFSGLDGARRFKRDRLSELTESEYAIFQGADAAAGLVVGGRVAAAAAEERFDGQKHSEAFPAAAAHFCLSEAGIGPDDLDLVAHCFSYGPERDFYLGQQGYYNDLYREVLAPEANRAVAEKALGTDLGGRFLPVPHHLAHAAGAYLPSGFDRALVLVSDGLGERHSATVLAAGPNGFETVRAIGAHDSLGLLYGLFTLYLGFRFGDGEYKVMGLAPHGDASRHRRVLERLVELAADGTYRVPVLLENVTDLDKETYRPALAELERLLGPRRSPGAPMEQRYMDIAAALQAVLERAQLHLLRAVRAETGLDRLCVSGGVGLNCVANGVVLRSGLFDEVHVQPAAGDDGAALGAALYAAWQSGERPEPEPGTLLGPRYGAEECERAARTTAGVRVTEAADDAELTSAVAGLLNEGLVVGWFQGRMEFGPRALGNRSILADPRRADMRDRINALVKKRESFRPFAPAVTAEAAAGLFELDPEDVHMFAAMLFVAHVRDEHAVRMPATTHVDGSARVQTVSRTDNPRFWGLLRAFETRTGLPVLLNTSFNVAGQPIVRTPREAVDTFLDAGLDALVMDRLIIRRVGAADPSHAEETRAAR